MVQLCTCDCNNDLVSWGPKRSVAIWITDVSPQVQIAPTVTPRVYFAPNSFRPKMTEGVWGVRLGRFFISPQLDIPQLYYAPKSVCHFPDRIVEILKKKQIIGYLPETSSPPPIPPPPPPFQTYQDTRMHYQDGQRNKTQLLRMWNHSLKW